MSKPSLFTPEVLTSIPTWVEEGTTPEEIARRIGCELSTLVVRCCQYKITLRRQGDLGFPFPQLRLSHVAHEKVALRAAEMGIGYKNLLVVLIEGIAEDDLFDAILDDEP